MTSLADEEVDISDWLCAIHLERYQDNFSQHGYHRVKDILSVDNEVLQQIGIGATGHRKRIISRLRNISGDSKLLSPSSGMETPEPLEYLSKEENDKSTGYKDQADGKIIYPEPIVKPVPKPRTVFNKSTITTNKDLVVAMMFTTTTTSSSSSDHLGPNSATDKKASSLRETTVQRGSSLDTMNCNSYTGLKPEGVEMEAGSSQYTSAGVGKTFHPIPPLPMRQNKETSQTGSSYQQYKLQMEADTIQCSPLSILSSFAGSIEEVTSFSTSPPSPQETLTMISNEIYSGFGPRTDSVSCATDIKGTPNYLNPPDMIKQETTPTPERIKSPLMRNSTVKPAPMKSTPSSTPGSMQDGVCPRPAPVGISASPTTSRLRTTAPGRPLPVGNQAQIFSNQKRNTVSITFSTASLRPNPVGDSGSPRLPRTGQVAFPRPAPIGHSASPMLPRVRNSPPQRTESPQNDDISIQPVTNPTSSRQVKKKPSTMRQEVTGNTSLQRQKSVTKNTLHPSPAVRKNSSGSPPGPNEILQRPTPVGNAGSSNTPSIRAPSQKSFLLRYTAPLRPTVLKSVPGAHSGPQKPVFHTQSHVAEQESVKSVVNPTNNMSKRPTPMGISPSSSLKKSFTKKPVANIPSPKTAVSSLPKLKSKELKVQDLTVSHQGSLETVSVPKAKPDGLVPRTKCIVSLATQKVKASRNDSSLRLIEAEHCSVERTKVKGSKFLLKQKPAEKDGLSIQKSAGSVTFQRPKQTGSTSSQPPKCRNVVSSTKISQPSSALPRSLGNAEVKKSSCNTGISLSKVIKNIPSARPKQKDATMTNLTTLRPQPVGNTSTSVSKLKSTVSLNNGKLSEGIVRTPPKKIAGNLLPRLPFMQKKSPPKMSLLKTSPSRAGENSYLVCSPGRKTAPSVPEEEESDMNPLLDMSSSMDESFDLHKTYRDSWEVDLTEESLEAALRASATTFNPIQDEHLVLVRPRLMGSHLSDAFLEQKYRISKTNDG